MSRVRNPLVRSLLDLRGNGRACVYTEPMWGLSMMLVLPYAGVYMLALGIKDQEIGLLATISMLSQVVFGLLGGVITDKLGRRFTTAAFDLLAWSVPCLIWAFAQNFWAFLIASLINGAWQVTQNSWDCLLVEDVPRSELTKVYSLVKAAGGVLGAVRADRGDSGGSVRAGSGRPDPLPERLRGDDRQGVHPLLLVDRDRGRSGPPGADPRGEHLAAAARVPRGCSD